jgi:hypothetical protein
MRGTYERSLIERQPSWERAKIAEFQTTGKAGETLSIVVRRNFGGYNHFAHR